MRKSAYHVFFSEMRLHLFNHSVSGGAIFHILFEHMHVIDHLPLGMMGESGAVAWADRIDAALVVALQMAAVLRRQKVVYPRATSGNHHHRPNRLATFPSLYPLASASIYLSTPYDTARTSGGHYRASPIPRRTGAQTVWWLYAPRWPQSLHANSAQFLLPAPYRSIVPA